jgi:ABC-type polysaccharide/polyol phosphate export permease
MQRKKQLHNWETIWMLAKTDLKMRYQGTWLGIILWSFFAEATTVGMNSLLSKSHDPAS